MPRCLLGVASRYTGLTTPGGAGYDAGKTTVKPWGFPKDQRRGTVLARLITWSSLVQFQGVAMMQLRRVLRLLCNWMTFLVLFGVPGRHKTRP